MRKPPLSFIVATALWSVSAALPAQPVFTNSYGGDMAEDGLGVVSSGPGFKVATEVFDDATGHRAGWWTFSNTGSLLASLPVGPASTTFVQGTTLGPSSTVFICGSTILPDSSTHEGLLMKLDAADNVLFTYIGSAPRDQQYFDVAPLTDGGAIVCGVDDPAGKHDALIARIDASGTQLWSVTTGGPLDEEANAVAVSGSDVMITGRQMNYGGTSDCFFARLDLNGNVAWSTSWGGDEDDAGEDLVVTNPGKFVMAGTTNSFGVYDNTEHRIKQNVYLIKIDLLGDTLWTAALGDTLFDRRGNTLDVASDGDLLIAGERELDNAVDALVLRTDDVSHLLWEKTYDVDGWDRLLDIGALNDGFVACGWSFGPLSRQVLLIRRDQQGD